MNYELNKSSPTGRPVIGWNCWKLRIVFIFLSVLQGGETYGIIEISLWLVRIVFNVSIENPQIDHSVRQHHDKRPEK